MIPSVEFREELTFLFLAGTCSFSSLNYGNCWLTKEKSNLDQLILQSLKIFFFQLVYFSTLSSSWKPLKILSIQSIFQKTKKSGACQMMKDSNFQDATTLEIATPKSLTMVGQSISFLQSRLLLKVLKMKIAEVNKLDRFLIMIKTQIAILQRF